MLGAATLFEARAVVGAYLDEARRVLSGGGKCSERYEKATELMMQAAPWAELVKRLEAELPPPFPEVP